MLNAFKVSKDKLSYRSLVIVIPYRFESDFESAPTIKYYDSQSLFARGKRHIKSFNRYDCWDFFTKTE